MSVSQKRAHNFWRRSAFSWIGGVAALAGTSVLAQNQSMFEGFMTYCVPQAMQNAHVPRDGLIPMTKKEVEDFSTGFQLGAVPDAVWIAPNNDWLIIDRDQSHPRDCTVFAFAAPVTHNVDEWNVQIVEGGVFTPNGPAGTSENRGAGWATKPTGDGFVEVGLSNTVLQHDPFISLVFLTAKRVGFTPKSCALLPAACP